MPTVGNWMVLKVLPANPDPGQALQGMYLTRLRQQVHFLLQQTLSELTFSDKVLAQLFM